MRTISIKLIYLLLFIGVFSGCQQDNVQTQPATESMGHTVDKIEEVSNEKSAPIEQQTPWISATVKYLEFEGGFYGIVTNKGIKLLPINLAKKYRQHGLTIEVQGYDAQGVMTIHQWGKPFKITDIKLLKK